MLNQMSTAGAVIWTRSSGELLNRDAERPSATNVIGVAPNSTFKTASDSTASTVVVIEKRALLRECLTLAIRSLIGQTVLSYPSVEKWLEDSSDRPVSLVLVCAGSGSRDVEEIRQLLLLMSPSVCHVPSILLSDIEDADQIVDALHRGARGYIPTSVPLDVAIEAMRLVRAGGVYVPASSLMAAKRSLDGQGLKLDGNRPRLTARQLEVAEALRKGRANKIIAYELGMRESTVKVHVRNIMRKMKAHNRTEVAFKMNRLNGSSEA